MNDFNYLDYLISIKEIRRIEKYRKELTDIFVKNGIIDNVDCMPDDDYILNNINVYYLFKEIVIEKREELNKIRRIKKQKSILNELINVSISKKRERL